MEATRTVRHAGPASNGGFIGDPDDGERPAEISAAPSAGGDKRSSHRQRTLKQAKVILTDSTMIDCTMRDVTEAGARLVFGDAFLLPEEFRLLVVSTNAMLPARLLWQRGASAGVAFTGPGEPAASRKY